MSNSSTLPLALTAPVKTMTWAAIQSLRDASALEPGCWYQADDVTWISGHPGSFTALATGISAIARQGLFEATTLNPGAPWPGLFDWATGALVQLSDPDLNNSAHPAEQVQVFPWGNSAVRGVTVDGGQLAFSGGRLEDVRICSAGRVTISGGLLRDASVCDAGQVTQSGGRLTQITVARGGRILEFSGAGTVRHATIQDGGTLVPGSWAGRASYVTINSGGRVYLDGSDGQVNYLAVSSQGYLWCRNAPALRLDRMELSSRAQLNLDGMTAGRVQRVSGSDFGQVDGRAFAGSATNIHVASRGVVRLRAFTGTASGVSSDSLGIINATGAALSLSSVSANGGGIINASGAAATAQVNRSVASARGEIWLRRAASTVSNVSAQASGRLQLDNSGEGSVSNLSINSAARLYANALDFIGAVSGGNLSAGARLLCRRLKGNITETKLTAGARVTVDKPAGEAMTRCAYAKLSLNRSTGTTTNESLGWT